MAYEWFLAKRYLWSKRRHPFVGVVSFVAVAGIALGTASLIVVMAVMNGFDEDLKSRIIGTRAHLVIEKDQNFTEYPQIILNLQKNPSIAGAAAFIEGQALVQNGQWGTGVLVRGVSPDDERKVSNLSSHLKQGSFLPQMNSAVLGNELVRRLHLKVGEKVSILTQNLDKPEIFSVDGVFSTGMYEYDANLLYIDLPAAQEIFKTNGSVSGISVNLRDVENADLLKNELQRKLGYPYFVSTWMEMNKTLFGALKLEKIVMFLILALIILVAALNIAGSLTILVVNKTRDIGILKSIGATTAGIVKIFTLDGLLIGLVGTGMGLVLGTVLCFAIGHFRIVELPREIYYLDQLPVRMSLPDTGLVVMTALLLSLICSVYPAWIAGKLDPVKAFKA